MTPEKLIDELDAYLFSGDEFFESCRLSDFDETLARWQRRIAEIRKMLAEERAEWTNSSP